MAKKEITSKDMYRELTLEVAEDVCEKNNVPTCTCYQKAVAEKLSEMYGHQVDYTDIHGPIYQILNEKYMPNPFLKMGKGYYPKGVSYLYGYYGKLIKQRIRFWSDEVHVISENTCVVKLADSHTEPDVTTAEILELFEHFIDDNCYALKIIDNYLVIMLRDGSSADKISIKDIARVVKETNEKRPRKKKIRKRRTVSDILGEDFQYYYFDQSVTCRGGSEDEGITKRFLTLECGSKLVVDVYNIIEEMRKPTYETFYRGHSSVVVVFDVTESTDGFDSFLRRLEEDKEVPIELF